MTTLLAARAFAQAKFELTVSVSPTAMAMRDFGLVNILLEEDARVI